MIDRPTARVILLDPENRVLLFKFQGDHVRDPALPAGAVQPRVFWVTPGGGLTPGETFKDAAIRELWEETGINDVVLRPVVIEREKLILVRDEPIFGREQYFVAWTGVTDVLLDNQEDAERADYRDHRWWTVDELISTDQTVYPEGFAERVREIIAEMGKTFRVAAPTGAPVLSLGETSYV